MHINTVRKVINKHNADLAKEVKARAERTGKSITEVSRDDPFLAGQAYALGRLTLELIALQEEENERRDRARR